MWLSAPLSALATSYLIHIHKHNDMAAACLEEAINPRQGTSCKSEGIQGILPLSATFSSPPLYSPLLSLLSLGGSHEVAAHEWPQPYWQCLRQGTDATSLV